MLRTPGRVRFQSFARAALAAALTTLGVVCSAASIRLETADREEDTERIQISGKIEKGDAERFIALATRNVKTVVVSSRGGDLEASLAIGKVIHERQMAVEVDGDCFSACAQAIFLGGATKSLRRRSFLAFHAGDTTLKKLLLEEYAKFTPAKASDAESLATRVADMRVRHDLLERRLASFNEIVGLRPEVVEFFVTLTSPSKLRVEINAEGTAHRATMQPPPCDYWVPDAVSLRAVGVNVPDFQLPSVNWMARHLSTSAERIYFGPVPNDSSPVQLGSLCVIK